MAFEKRTWFARIGQGLNKFIIGEKDSQGKQELTNSPDSITQEGDVISADNLNDLEDRIAEGFNEMKLTKIWENPDPHSPLHQISYDDPIVIDEVLSEVVVQYLTSATGIETEFAHMGIMEEADTQTAVFSLRRTTISNPLPPASYGSCSHLSRGIQFYQNTSEYPNQTAITVGICLSFRTTLDANGNATFSITQVDGSLVPIAIYKVGDIYNS